MIDVPYKDTEERQQMYREYNRTIWDSIINQLRMEATIDKTAALIIVLDKICHALWDISDSIQSK